VERPLDIRIPIELVGALVMLMMDAGCQMNHPVHTLERRAPVGRRSECIDNDLAGLAGRSANRAPDLATFARQNRRKVPTDKAVRTRDQNDRPTSCHRQLLPRFPALEF